MDVIAIARFGRGHKIILSFFTPDICILLAIKQKSFLLVFINNARQLPVSDKEKRTGSLQLIVRFAKQWGLAGIVFVADSLVICPRLINYIRSQGIICGTYNALNNETASVEVWFMSGFNSKRSIRLIDHSSFKVKAGIDLIVADRVRRISRLLKTLGS